MNVFTPKNRKYKFDVRLKIVDLNNVPLVTGAAYVKWHLAGSPAAEHRGKTNRASIKDHKVAWDYETGIQVRMTADKSGILQTANLEFEVLQEIHFGPKGERILLGNVRLNLAQYVDDNSGGEGEITRRHLLQDSKINSTLKLSLLMTRIEGERNYKAQPLADATLFGGIAGVFNLEQKDNDRVGDQRSMSSRSLHDFIDLPNGFPGVESELWSSGDLELHAQQCIDDIFAGGDGWGKRKESGMSIGTRSSIRSSDMESDEERSPLSRSREGSAGRRFPTRSHSRSQNNGRNHGHRSLRHEETIRQLHSRSPSRKPEPAIAEHREDHERSSGSDDHRKPPKRTNEFSEFSLREDLRSWHISAPSD